MDKARFLKACRGEPVDTVPVWFMRQAGRYQASYRAIRQKYTLLEIARDPLLCTEVTVRPVEELGVDAAILFSDIMVPLEPMGVDFEIRENVGPIVFRPFRHPGDVARLRPVNPEQSLEFALEAIRRIVARIRPLPVIGFAGAPFTLASYLIEGGPSRDYLETKKLMWRQPQLWDELMARLAQTVGRYLLAQIKAGAEAVQIFDSWVGALALDDYRAYVLPHLRQIFQMLAPTGAAVIYFGVNTHHLLEAIKEAGPSVIGVDWRTPLSEARRRLGGTTGLQGNLDPALLLADWTTVKSHSQRIMDEMAGQPGYIFNLGHGVLKDTEPEQLRSLVKWVHEYGRQTING